MYKRILLRTNVHTNGYDAVMLIMNKEQTLVSYSLTEMMIKMK